MLFIGNESSDLYRSELSRVLSLRRNEFAAPVTVDLVTRKKAHTLFTVVVAVVKSESLPIAIVCEAAGYNSHNEWASMNADIIISNFNKVFEMTRLAAIVNSGDEPL